MTRPFSDQAIPSVIIRQAAVWLSRIQEKPLTQSEQLALNIWRSQSEQHEQAWQRAEMLTQKLESIPAVVGLSVLDRPESLSRRAFIKPVVLLAIAAPTGYLSYRLLPWQSWNADYQTAKGEQKNIQLADGSTLKINTNSAIDIVFDSKQRLIKLYQGEIYIETAHDALARPFLVETSHGRLRALGTKFVVSKQETNSYLGVVENAVEVSPAGNALSPFVVNAGQQVMFSASSINQHMALDDNATAWLDGIIYADNMPLSEFISILSRYRKGRINCDSAAANILISGAFQLKNPDDILEILQKTRPLRIEWRTRYWATIYKT